LVEKRNVQNVAARQDERQEQESRSSIVVQ
jgi:hypothetical protein